MKLLLLTLSALPLVACNLNIAGNDATHSDAGAPPKHGSPDASSPSTGGSTHGPDASSEADSSSGDDASPSAADDSAVPDAAPSVGPFLCKRGVASTVPPSNALARSGSAPGVAWWYSWGNEPPAGGDPGIEFVPMIWGTGALNGPIPANARYLLGFNEPNFANQSNMTAKAAAANWPSVEGLAQAQGIPIVSPGLNFCGSQADPSGCTDPSVTDPYTYFRDFLAACPSPCEVDHIAVHWYNCDLPSLKAYIDGNDTLEGWVQFGKPIWLTEFACDGSHSVAEQQAYMQAAVAYLEGNPHVFRYSWFSASAIPTSLLTASDGSLTALGQTYVSLPTDCP